MTPLTEVALAILVTGLLSVAAIYFGVIYPAIKETREQKPAGYATKHNLRKTPAVTVEHNKKEAK